MCVLLLCDLVSADLCCHDHLTRMSAGFIVSEIFSEGEYMKHGVTLKQGAVVHDLNMIGWGGGGVEWACGTDAPEGDGGGGGPSNAQAWVESGQKEGGGRGAVQRST
jgi:hypothetical protein